MTATPLTIAIAVALAALAVGTLLGALYYNAIMRDRRGTRRVNTMKTPKRARIKETGKKIDEKQRRKQRQDALKNVEEQRKKGRRVEDPPMPQRLVQAGLSINMRQFILISMVIGLVIAFIAFLQSGSPLFALALGFVGGFGLPRWFVNFKRKRRLRAFILAFPNAIDIIVRGIRSGLPLNDCMRIIANDTAEPVRGEFRKLVETTQLGVSIPEACDRLYQAVPTSETNFFSIVITIQSSAGGNLSEALANLSKVLRERRKMSDKIQAVSMEAKASAAIIGSLPFIVAILVWFSTPGYLDPLFFETSGHKVLFFCALSMFFGIIIMRRMINFKF
ncbi:MAG: type II secretion system F family protein [Ahrensia sp.]|nr:type II secretion system F family protein [Ahrensia sp.]